MYFVSRQCYWPDGIHCVEIAAGGLDYANPDMLVEKYAGEGEEYEDPREAVEAAINIRKLWQADNPDYEISVDYGCTGGMTMPFTDDNTDDELRTWAQGAWDKLPKCDHCGEAITTKYRYSELDDEEFCSEYCAEERWEEYCEHMMMDGEVEVDA